MVRGGATHPGPSGKEKKKQTKQGEDEHQRLRRSTAAGTVEDDDERSYAQSTPTADARVNRPQKREFNPTTRTRSG